MYFFTHHPRSFNVQHSPYVRLHFTNATPLSTCHSSYSFLLLLFLLLLLLLLHLFLLLILILLLLLHFLLLLLLLFLSYYDTRSQTLKEKASAVLFNFETLFAKLTVIPKKRKLPSSSPSSSSSSSSSPKIASQTHLASSSSSSSFFAITTIIGPGKSTSTPMPPGDPFDTKEAQGLSLLTDYIMECGGTRENMKDWYVTIEHRKDGKTSGSSDMYYFSPPGKKFRSRAEVARHFMLAAAPPKRVAGTKKKSLTYVGDRRRVQKEIDKLVATKLKVETKLTEFQDEAHKSQYPMDDSLLESLGTLSPQSLPPAEGTAIPGIAPASMTDFLSVWDFLSTFSKTLLLTPAPLEDFAQSLTSPSDAFSVHLAEAHVAVIRLLLADPTSENWWKLEPLPGTLEAEKEKKEALAAEKEAAAKEKEATATGDASDDDMSDDDKSDDENDAADDDASASGAGLHDEPKSRTVAELLLSSCERPLKEAVLPVNFALYAGIVAERVLAMFAKRRVEEDNEVRVGNGLKPLSAEEAKERRKNAAVRLFPPCVDGSLEPGAGNPLDFAIAHLSSGGKYSSLSCAQKLLVLRLLLEALYETDRIRSVVEDNNSSRYNAEKSLEDEQKKEAREEREAWSAMLQRAKEDLVARQKNDFLDDRRQEMKEKDPSDPMVFKSNEELLEDEAINAQCDASTSVPNRTEIHEQASHLKRVSDLGEGDVKVVSLDELTGIDEAVAEKLEKEGRGAVCNIDALDSDAVRLALNRQEISALKDLKYRRDTARARVTDLPFRRGEQIRQLEEAAKMDDIKMLRSSIKAARMYDLQGRTSLHEKYIEETLMKAILALKAGEERRKKNLSKKALVQQRDACFVRTVPIGQDRKFRRFWVFPGDHANRLWIEETSTEIGDSTGAEKVEEGDLVSSDMVEDGGEDAEKFRVFSKQEYFAGAEKTGTPSSAWSYYVTEKSCRALVQQLDVKGNREGALKESLRQVIDNRARPDNDGEDDVVWKFSGDSEALAKSCTGDPRFAEIVKTEDMAKVPEVVAESAIGKRVRKGLDDGGHVMGTVTGWVEGGGAGGADGGDGGGGSGGGEQTAADQQQQQQSVPFWHISFDAGEEEHWEAYAVVGGILAATIYLNGNGEVEEKNGAISAYKNSLGKYGLGQGCKTAEVHQALLPLGLAQFMLKREGDIFPAMKEKAKKNPWEDTWAGKEGMRNLWTMSLKDAVKAADENEIKLSLLKQSLLNLEESMLQVCSGPSTLNAKLLSLDEMTEENALNGSNMFCYAGTDEFGGVQSAEGLWPNAEARNIFLSLVDRSDSIAVLASCLDVLAHNCKKCSMSARGANNRTGDGGYMAGGGGGGGTRSGGGSAQW